MLEQAASGPDAQMLARDTLTPSDSQATREWLAQTPANTLTLRWPQPQAYIAACLMTATPIEQALARWQSMANQALWLFRQHRRQVALEGIVISEAAAQAASLYRLAAAHLVDHDASLQEALSYLVASSQRQAASESAEDTARHALDDVHQHEQTIRKQIVQEKQLAKQEYDRLTHQLSDTLEENKRQLHQLRTVQEALKTSEQQRDAQEKTLTQEKNHHQAAVKARETSEQKLKDAMQHHDDLQKENELLVAQLHKVQETLEGAAKRHKKDAEALKTSEQQRDAQETTLTQEKNQHQAVAKARETAEQKLKDAMQHYDDLQKENELLVAQLHKVQETLEGAVQRHKKDAEARKASEQRSAALEKTLTQEKKHHQAAAKARETAAQKIKDTMQHHHDLEEENALLVEQLHSVQEALEEAYLKQTSKEASLTKQLEDSQAHQQTVHRLQSLITWLRAHAYRHAVAAYRHSRAYKKSLPKLVDLLDKSDFFDAVWYREQYDDVATSNINPAEHFIKFGALEGRNPSPLFDTESYLVSHPDVAMSGQHPLLHYIRDGITEHRTTKQEVAQ
ncbi:hypothetical protein [Halomonas sp. SpR8]|uniref:hypothetical protein n=1 Tax=Halomonas sp. SpR8 TaxID=3050463 RepID=UPI0027E3D1AA|nr:hypothetical protein [Halomonas sp. SpR8]MDQ7727282.1 hypothetical protein [Halomonas sp. SpR8]